MKTVYTPKKIFRLYEKWQSFMEASWGRGNDNLRFVEQSEQDIQVGEGKLDFEPMSFNFQWKILKTAQANGKDIELSLNLNSLCETEVKEKQSFKMLMQEIMLNGRNSTNFAAALDKVYSFGQGVLHVKNIRENEKTLNQILVVENMADPTSAFFDKRSRSPTFNDGEFCGRISTMARSDLVDIYPQLSRDGIKSEVRIADFWYKSRHQVSYIPLTSGEYKREDLINPGRDLILTGTPPKKGMMTKISYVRCVEGATDFLEKALNMDFNILPMAIDYGGMMWTGEKYESYPLGYHLKDTQILLNYAGSVMADIMKSTTADKWFFSPEHTTSQASKLAMNEINEREGGMLFEGNLATIRREQCQQLPAPLVEVFNQLQTTIQSLAGSYFDNNSSEIKASSGVALDKMFKRVDLVQNPVIAAHITTLTLVGQILQAMIPIFYKETRTLCVQTSAGTQQMIKINEVITQPNGMEQVENNVSDLKSTYDYQISVAPSKKLQQQNLQTELAQLYQLYPQAIPTTIDLYAQSLDVAGADIIAKRLGINIPQQLVAYANGQMSLEEYKQFASKQQQMVEQKTLQSPEAQLISAKTKGEMGRTQADMSRSHTDQFNAQTQRLKEVANAGNQHNKTVADAFKVSAENDNTARHEQLELLKTTLAHGAKLTENLPLDDKA